MWWCQPCQERTSYSSRPVSPLAVWNSVSITQRAAATWARASGDVPAGALDR